MESLTQSPREGAGAVTYTYGRHAGYVPRRADVEKSMMAYTQRARLLISTSLPDGLNHSPRPYQQRAAFNPATWAQGGLAGHQPPDYSLDYTFPNFKDREDVMPLGRRNLREKSTLKLFIGTGDPVESSIKSSDRPTGNLVKPLRRARKPRRAASVASIQTDKTKTRSSLTTHNDETMTTTTSTKGTTYGSYQMALDGGTGSITVESETSGPDLSTVGPTQEGRGAKLHKGAYSIGRLFPPRQQPRARKKKRNRKSPVCLMVGHDETRQDGDRLEKGKTTEVDPDQTQDKLEEDKGISEDQGKSEPENMNCNSKQNVDNLQTPIVDSRISDNKGFQLNETTQRNADMNTTKDTLHSIGIGELSSTNGVSTNETGTNAVNIRKLKNRKVVQPSVVTLPLVVGQDQAIGLCHTGVEDSDSNSARFSQNLKNDNGVSLASERK